MRHRTLFAVSLAFAIFAGVGCQSAISVPANARATLDQYLSAMRAGDFTTMRQALCSNFDRDVVIQRYQNAFDTDRTAIANAFQDAAPDPTSSTTNELKLIANVNLYSGNATRQITLSQSGTGWCIYE
jgi:hypothetical protein